MKTVKFVKKSCGVTFPVACSVIDGVTTGFHKHLTEQQDISHIEWYNESTPEMEYLVKYHQRIYTISVIFKRLVKHLTSKITGVETEQEYKDILRESCVAFQSPEGDILTYKGDADEFGKSLAGDLIDIDGFMEVTEGSLDMFLIVCPLFRIKLAREPYVGTSDITKVKSAYLEYGSDDWLEPMMSELVVLTRGNQYA